MQAGQRSEPVMFAGGDSTGHVQVATLLCNNVNVY